MGKSTLFNALTALNVAASNYPFCTIDPTVGVVEVPDGRLAVLSKLSKSRKLLPAVMEFIDIAGLVKGASQGEGLGNKFLTNIRETDAIIHVVRCFESEDVVHVEGKVDPLADVEVIELELQLADIEMAENALVKVGRQARSGQKEAKIQAAALEKSVAHLNDGKPLRTLELSDEERAALDEVAARRLVALRIRGVPIERSFSRISRRHAPPGLAGRALLETLASARRTARPTGSRR